MLIALVVLVTIGAFIIGITTAWLAKGYVEDYIENAAYAKSVTHPEMLDEDGNIIPFCINICSVLSRALIGSTTLSYNPITSL